MLSNLTLTYTTQRHVEIWLFWGHASHIHLYSNHQDLHSRGHTHNESSKTDLILHAPPTLGGHKTLPTVEGEGRRFSGSAVRTIYNGEEAAEAKASPDLILVGGQEKGES